MAKVKMEKLRAHKLARNVLDRTNNLIEEFGGRLAGSDACRNVAKALLNELADSCDQSSEESFVLRRDLLRYGLRGGVVIYVVALFLLYLRLPLVALLIMGAFLTLFFYQLIFYHLFFEKFYPGAQGINIWGVVEPQEEPTQTFIVTAHHDSAQIPKYLDKRARDYLVKVGGAFLCQLSLCVIAVVRLFSGQSSLVINLLLTAGFFLVRYLWTFYSSEVASGAGDNLVGSSLVVELAAYFAQQKHDGRALRQTRLILASFDGEEAFLQGSRAFYQKHREELSRLPLYNLNLDSLFQAHELTFLTSDINGRVKLSQKMATAGVNFAQLMGYEAYSQPIAFLSGGTDAARAAQAGFEATTLMAASWKEGLYHTAEDVVTAVEPLVIEMALSIAIKFIEHFDQGETDGPSVERTVTLP